MATDLQKRLGDSAETLYLLDTSSFIFRAFFAIQRSMNTKLGEPTNAVYGVATMIARLVDEARPEFLAAVYDSKEPSFRKELFQEYKANRTEAPPELVPQFDRIEQLVKCMEIFSYRKSGVEADDLIATLTKKWCKASPQHRVVIVSSDKDLMQLVNERVQVWDTMSNKIYGSSEVIEKFGVEPSQIRDYLGLVGDSSDNIPGVPGVGPKTASDLLKQYGDLEGILKAAVDKKISGKKCDVINAHAEDARLSAKLATVHETLDVEVDPPQVKYQFNVNSDCISLLTTLEFHSLLKRWTEVLLPTLGRKSAINVAEQLRDKIETNVSDQLKSKLIEEDSGKQLSDVKELLVASMSVPENPSDLFKTVSTEKDFKKLLESLERSKAFGFDLETTSLNPRAAKLCGVALCYDSNLAFYVPVGHQGFGEQLAEKYVLEKLRPLLESTEHKKIGQNLKYDFSVLNELGIKAQGIGADTMVAAYVLDPEGRHNLETLAARYLEYKVTTFEEVCGKGKDQITFDQVPIELATRYSAEDALIALRLWGKLEPKLKSEGLMRVFTDIDLPMVMILSAIEEQGVCIDTDWLKKLSGEFQSEMKSIEEQIATFTQGPINLNSPKQLAHLLFDELKLPVQGKTKTGFSTDAKVLETLAPLHEVPRLLLEYREVSKLKGTYVDPLPLLRDQKTGKIHASFHQTVAATGRLSSSDPNLQNIPTKTEKGRKIRRAFIPSPGNILLSADYSQIELRLLAHMSGDKELSSSFKKEEDVHRRTASEIFSVKPEQVDDRQRGIAKAINFGLMYGKSAFALSQELEIPRKEAAQMIERYFTRYSGVKSYLDQSILDAKEKGYATTLLGRKRPLKDINNPNHAIRSGAERMAMNSPIQGTAADLMKLAMIEIDRRLKKGAFQSKLTIQVHDEVVLDCPKGEVKEVEKLVSDSMVNALEGFVKLDVPLSVNAATGMNWQEL
jgi:DNA polymerase-1